MNVGNTRTLATVVLATHTLFELPFGLNAFLTGTSSQTADGLNSAPSTIPIRFLGSALLALGLLGAIALVRHGATSPTARTLGIGFGVFHALGAIGILIAASNDASVLDQPLTVGALVVHGLLAVGFGATTLLPAPPEPTTAVRPSPAAAA